ncbi:phage head closure protein [Gracilibacillus alcaliphilus]|uniref:phage head closure protein n=1 Tax=Gracilibacillus alcaliphilus TaxID=1401441 RepID=UPI00195EE16E|nr:phage head closure protein [Gracilibacillus alcaliphilus]MBM7678381.1 SPP1 family predicted phage head-tail adaptor [Gracilibacillus alcaliphilus]
MNSGHFRHRLIFQKPAGGTDDEGFPITDPTEYTKAWASLKTLKGRSFYAAATSNNENMRDFQIRYQPKLSDEKRPKNLFVIWRGKKHTIESVEDDDGLKKTMSVRLKVVS